MTYLETLTPYVYIMAFLSFFALLFWQKLSGGSIASLILIAISAFAIHRIFQIEDEHKWIILLEYLTPGLLGWGIGEIYRLIIPTFHRVKKAS